MKAPIPLLVFLLLSLTDSTVAQHFREGNANLYIENQSIPSDSASSQPMLHSLMHNYDVKYYRFDLEATNTSAFIQGSVAIGAENLVISPDTFVFELVSFYTVDSIKINDIKLEFSRENDLIKAYSVAFLKQYAMFECEVFYKGEIPAGMQEMNSGICYNSLYETTYTLSEPFFAKYWFPCKQDLRDKADSAFINITIPSGLKVGSNGMLTEVVDLGNGSIQYRWETYYPTAYYLLAFSVSNYLDYSFYSVPTDGDSLLIQNYIYDSASFHYYKPIIDKTDELIQIFSDLYGKYPFSREKYGHMMAPFSGGMEHQTMSTMGSFDQDLLAHELAHQWFGNNVTCLTWMDIWINEGFATYSELIAREFLNGYFPRENLAEMIYYLIEMAETGSVYVPQNNFDIDFANFNQIHDLTARIFDWRISYVKGAVILHMLRTEMNDDDKFFEILRTYLQAYNHKNASGEDFREILEENTGKDYAYFFEQWYYGEGYPIYNITWQQWDETIYLESHQTSSASGSKFFRMNMEYLLKYDDHDTLITIEQTQPDQTFTIPVDGYVIELIANPNNNYLAYVESIYEYYSNPTYVATVRTPGNYFLYPNPAHNLITIENKGKLNLKLSIIDLSGRVLQKSDESGEVISIDLSNLSAGIYFLQLKSIEDLEVMQFEKY